MTTFRCITPCNTAQLASLSDIEWLSQCGFPPSEGPWCYVGERAVALQSLESIDYENFQLERQNDITVYLHAHHRDAYQEWNAHNAYIKAGLDELFARIGTVVDSLEFPPVVMDSIKWDLLGYCQEVAYRQVGDIPIYFHDALVAYRAGRLPCGYAGEHPHGQLKIY